VVRLYLVLPGVSNGATGWRFDDLADLYYYYDTRYSTRRWARTESCPGPFGPRTKGTEGVVEGSKAQSNGEPRAPASRKQVLPLDCGPP